MTQQAGGVSAPLSLKDVLSLFDFRQLWYGQLISNFGDALTALALIFLVNNLTDGSASAIAYLMIAIGLPTATLGLFAGALVDRLPKRSVMLWSDATRTLFLCGYLLFVWLGLDNIIWIYLMAFIQASLGAFFNPAKGALIPMIVPENGLVSANSLSQMTTVIVSVLGAGVAGFVIGVYGLFWPVFALDVLTTIFSVFFIWRLVHRESSADLPAKSDNLVGTLMTDLKLGLSTLISKRMLVGMLFGLGFSMLALGAVNVLLPLLLINDLMVSEAWFGLVQLFQTLGMVLSGLLVGLLATRLKPAQIATVTLFVIGCGIAFFAGVSQLWQLFAILFVVGLMITPLQAIGMTIVQTNAPQEMMGRVGAALNAVTQIASLFSMFAAGFLADFWGMRTVFAGAGIMVAVVALLMGLIFRGAKPTDDQLSELVSLGYVREKSL